MQIYSEDQIKEIIDVKQAIKSAKETYKDCEEGKIYAGDRIYMPIRGEANVGQWLVANCTEKPYFGMKFSSMFAENRAKNLPVTISKIYLNSAEDGTLQAILDANYMTAIKTGASAAVATDLMARKDATSLAVIGTGLQAYSQVLAIQEVRELEKLYIFDIDAQRVKDFAKMIEEVKNRPYEIIEAASAKECVEDADIICTCTASKVPVFEGKDLKVGAHVNAIGSFTAFMQEIDTETVLRAEKVITEHTEGLWAAAGDILIPFNEGKITKDKVTGTVGQALTGKIVARDNDEQITLYESVGSGVLDIGLAITVYETLAGIK